jgi:hypothetical protein
MLVKNIFFLGIAVLAAASPHLENRAKTGSKGGSKGKPTSTCPSNNALTAGVTCAPMKFTAAQINAAVKQAKAMEIKGKRGKGLHFPFKYKPSKELEAKVAKGKSRKTKAGKGVKRDLEAQAPQEDRALQARRSRGARITRTKPKPTRTKPKTTNTRPKKTTGKKKPTTTKKSCKGATTKPGKDVWMFPILEKGVWKRECPPCNII